MDGSQKPPDPLVLTCWKDIARYFGKGVRTVQRWEREFGLPVRRPEGIDHKSPIIAHPGELDAWLKSRWSERNEQRLVQDLPEPLPNPVVLTELITTSQELRHMHSELMHQNKAAIAALIATCIQIRGERVARAQSEPLWGGETWTDSPR